MKRNARKKTWSKPKRVAASLSISPLAVGAALVLTQAPASAACSQYVVNKFTGYHKELIQNPQPAAGTVQGAAAWINHDLPLPCDGGGPLNQSTSSAWVGYEGPPNNIAQMGWVRIVPNINLGGTNPFFFYADTYNNTLPVPQYISPVYDNDNHSLNNTFAVYRDGNGTTLFVKDGVGVFNRNENWVGDTITIGGEINHEQTQFPGRVDPNAHVNFSYVRKLYNGQWYTQNLAPSTDGVNGMIAQASGRYAIGAGNGWFGIWDCRVPSNNC